MLAAPGSMLTPNLRLLRLLGRGGMGSVWLAEHLLLGSEVAVKLLSPELANDAEALERFRREATAVAQLKSPHVVGIHDLGDADGVPFFVMERLVGEDLGQRLDRVERLPIGTVTAIVVQTCKALARVHELGVVHRDLKPGNIFLTPVDGDLVVKLLDFGVAKTGTTQSLHQTSDQAVLGTPLYMSPEQVLSPRNVGPASDLYSLGVVVYECLAGGPPFDGETVGALHVAIANGRYTPISGIDPSLPATLDAWFARAFASDPQQRFRSAREMSDEFLSAAKGGWGTRGLSITSDSEPMRHPSMPAATMPAARPVASSAPFVAGVLAVLALIGGIVGATKLTKRADAPSPVTAAPTGTTSTTAAVASALLAPPAETGSVASAAPPVELDDPPPVPIVTETSAAPVRPATSGIKPAKPASPPAPRRKNRGF